MHLTQTFSSVPTRSLAVVLLATTAASELSAQQESAKTSGRDAYPHATEPTGTVRQIYDGVLTPDMAVNTFRNIDSLFPTRTVPRAATPVP